MPCDLHLPKNHLQLAGPVDHKGATFNAPIPLAVHAFSLVDPVGRRGHLALVAEQQEGQGKFLNEFLVRFLTVETHAHHHAPRFFNRRDAIAKVTGLLGTPWRTVFGIKIQNYLLAEEVFQLHQLARLIRKRERWCLITDCKLQVLLPSQLFPFGSRHTSVADDHAGLRNTRHDRRSPSTFNYRGPLPIPGREVPLGRSLYTLGPPGCPKG